MKQSQALSIMSGVLPAPCQETLSILTDSAFCHKLRYEIGQPDQRLKVVVLATIDKGAFSRPLRASAQTPPATENADELLLTRYLLVQSNPHTHPSEHRRQPIGFEIHRRKTVLAVLEDPAVRQCTFNLVTCGMAALIMPDLPGQGTRSAMQIAFTKEMPILVEQDPLWASSALSQGRLQVSTARELIADLQEIERIAAELEKLWYGA